MDDPKAFARAVARHLGALAPPTPPPPPSPPLGREGDGEPSVFGAIDFLFERVNADFDALRARITSLELLVAELKAKPAAREVIHQRDSAGAVIKSVIIGET